MNRGSLSLSDTDFRFFRLLAAAQCKTYRDGKLGGVFLKLLFVDFYLTFDGAERIKHLCTGDFFEKRLPAERLLKI
jgi:hypothetical protein